MAHYKRVRDRLDELTNNIHDSGATLYLNVAKDDKILGFYKICLKNYYFANEEDAIGMECARINSLFLKSVSCNHSCLKCGCIMGRFDALIWVGSDKNVNEWLPANVVAESGSRVTFISEKYFNCNVYVHQTKIRPGSGLSDPKLVVYYGQQYEETKVVSQSLSAVWNEVLVLENVKLFDIGPSMHQPYLMLSLLDEDRQHVKDCRNFLLNNVLNYLVHRLEVPLK